MITFILNNDLITTNHPSGGSLLDFIRYEANLPGTKIGCREGDCGACTVLMGTLEDCNVSYKSVVSCLTPLGNAHGKHIVTIEGINTGHLSPVQKAFVENSATQCGFCTPGFIMSLTAESLSPKKTTKETAIASISGNICRCTGYKSIERAAEAIAEALKDKNIDDPAGWLVAQKHLPESFLSVPQRLKDIPLTVRNHAASETMIAGGTDLMVQKADELADTEINLLYERNDLKGIKVENGRCTIGAATTISEIAQSSAIHEIIPDISSYINLVASEPVKNMATVAGNIVNASPIGDITIMLLALDAEVNLLSSESSRKVPLRNFFLSYKKTDMRKDELISSITFNALPNTLFSFEKVSKRTHLDIASVNSAIQLSMDGIKISTCNLSAGGVSPVPLFLKKTSGFLSGKEVNRDIIQQANEIMQTEISPISDVRGSEKYKLLLLRQLLLAHFMKLFPEKFCLSTDLQ